MMPYNDCSQMLHISLETEKSFIAHPRRLLCVVGLEEYSAHDCRAATSVQRAPVTWRECGLCTNVCIQCINNTSVSACAVMVIFAKIFVLSLVWPFSYFPVLYFPLSILRFSISIPLDLGNFPPITKPLFQAMKIHFFVYFKGRGLATVLYMHYPQYLPAPKHHSSIYQSIQQGQIVCLQLVAMLNFQPVSFSMG